ncbi:sec-independent protein translocase protein TatC [Scopulibacillus darangshiensis]|uniref:Sec-independent protein translocase protein TatC n=1 Tax=Scopulibacillus darangshiensis TaxID=442528 RepID=A0A4R2NEQ8_9BACL|nr:twin-arginine translocase subunit TatC [Scopulibacillus darangshiensis]TCP19727.1 sec-independent protein translocase protein TatC [Scopulibacillus darangshiensis]
MSDKRMSVVDHLNELRRRIVTVLIGFIVTFIIGFFLAKPVIVFLQHADQAKDINMNAFRLTDPLDVYMKFAFIIGIVLISPLIMYQLWAFVRPGLYENEQKVTLAYIPLTLILFLGGVAFSYYIVFPNIVGFMGNLGEMLHIENTIGINEYFSFLLQMTLPFGILFQMPILVMFLTRLGIITPFFLTKIRKYAYFILLVIAGIITPPELLSQLMVTVPLIILYEMSIVISRFAYRRAMKQRSHED